MRHSAVAVGVIASLALLSPRRAAAQENFEIQVYPGVTMPKGVTMFELHSNYTSRGSTSTLGGAYPSNHALHETIEITRGFNDWLEVGFYHFMSLQDGDGMKYVGTHIRPRIAVPESRHWPVGLSLSQEIGYQREEFSADTWSWEIRPIIDKQMGKVYVSINPTVELALKGPGTTSGPEFSPNVQVGYDLSSKLNVALEYYGGFGPFKEFAPLRQSSQLLVPAINYDFGPDWEFNLGAGIALNKATDIVALKMIFGRRIGGK